MPSLRKKTILAPKKTFLAFPDHYVNLPGFIKFANLAGMAKADGAGKKVIAAGTVVCMKADGEVVKADGTNKANGIIFDEIVADDFSAVDVQINVAVLVHGFVREDRLDGDVATLKTNAPMINVVAK